MILNRINDRGCDRISLYSGAIDVEVSNCTQCTHAQLRYLLTPAI